MGSQVPTLLSDGNAKLLDGLRIAFDNPTDPSMNLWGRLAQLKNVNRDDVAMVWAFHTQSMTADLKRLGNYPGDKNLPTDVTLLDVEVGATKIPVASAPDVGHVVFGRMHTHLALNSMGMLDLAGGKDVDIDFLMTTPTDGSTPMNGAPVAIVQHGLGEWRGDSRYIAEAFAAKGWATMSIDINYHGNRSICTADSQCAGKGVCMPNGVCSTRFVVTCGSDADCSNGGTCSKLGNCSTDLARDSSRCMTHLEGGNPVTQCNPVASEAGFLNFTNLFAIRDNFRQHVLDLSQVERVITGADLKAKLLAKGIRIDPTRTAYIGQSLGGIEGTLFMAGAPAPTTAVLNVPGGRLPDILINSPAFGNLVGPLLKAEGVSKDTREYFQLLNTFRWILDPADPINFGKSLNGFSALNGAKKVIVQEAGADMVIPNPYTEALATEIGLPFVGGHVAGKQDDGTIVPTYFPGAAHGFIFQYPAGMGTDSGQKQAVTYLDSDGATLLAP